MEKEVSIIILNWRQRDLLKKCLSSLNEVTNYDNFNTIVVDNDSDDQSAQLVKEQFDWVTLIETSKNGGWAQGNNVGIKYTLQHHDPDFVLLMGSDIQIVEEDWLSTLVDVGTRDGVGVVGCELVHPNGVLQETHLVTNEKNYHQRDKCRTLDTMEWVSGACFLINCNVISTIGYIDEIFSPVNYDEADYQARAMAAGFDVVHTKDTEVLHHGSPSKDLVDDYELLLEIRRNRIQYVLLNGGWEDFLQQFTTELKLFAGCFVEKTTGGFSLPLPRSRPDTPLAKAILKSILDNVTKISELVSKRQRRTEFIEGGNLSIREITPPTSSGT